MNTKVGLLSTVASKPLGLAAINANLYPSLSIFFAVLKAHFMPNDLQFPFVNTCFRALVYFALAIALILLWGGIADGEVSARENSILEISQSSSHIITAVIAALAFLNADKRLLKVACLLLTCIALLALVRETQSCPATPFEGGCLPRLLKRILSGLIVISAIAGTVFYFQALKDNFKELLTPATLWPAFAILALALISQLSELLESSNAINLGIDHGFLYLEEFSELLGALFCTSLAVHFFKKAKGQ